MEQSHTCLFEDLGMARFEEGKTSDADQLETANAFLVKIGPLVPPTSTLEVWRRFLSTPGFDKCQKTAGENSQCIWALEIFELSNFRISRLLSF